MNNKAREMTLAVCLLVAAPLVVGCAGTQTRASTGQQVDDATITAKVKSQLLADPNVSGLQVNVQTFKGQVQLSGYVNSSDERARAEQIARQVAGVKNVSNDLIVKAAR